MSHHGVCEFCLTNTKVRYRLDSEICFCCIPKDALDAGDPSIDDGVDDIANDDV